MRGGKLPNSQEKWNSINQILREDDIGVLAVQETHLTDENVASLHSLYHKRLHILHSSDAERPNAGGVAFILNKTKTAWKEATKTVIIPGRAIMITMKQYANKPLRILNIYAPNSPADNLLFWEQINTIFLNRRIPKPHVMLGDFNLVENAIDRIPAHCDTDSTVESLQNLTSTFGLIDGWRHTFPNRLEFTYHQNTPPTQSRLDRIYLTRFLLKHSHGWTSDPVGFPTDHKCVTVKLFDPSLPHIGKGRWTMPLFLLKNKKLMSDIHELGQAAQSHITNSIHTRTNEHNPQTVYTTFKNELSALIRKYAKVTIPTLERKIASEKRNIEDILRNETMLDDEKRLAAGIAEERLSSLEESRFKKIRDNTAARNALEGETVSRYWIGLNKSHTPRDTMKCLKVPGTHPPQYVKRSDDMAELAKNFYESLQEQDECTSQTAHTEKVLDTLDRHLSIADSEELALPITESEIEDAIKSLPSGKAAGLDGIPHELWKQLATSKKDDTPGVPTFDIVKMLCCVFRDINHHGISPGSNFAEGWLCPLYKKKDRTEITNYRPITVLNADYKILTKIVSQRLTPIAPKLIHEDQTGFIKGRRISDVTELATLLVSSCETNKTNGIIVCLDQEKAYDRIRHDFLWDSLRKFGFPNNLIRLIRGLYESAYTSVIINGVLSDPFKVTRGVRQGDPLSCLLFNLAIESLACMIRRSRIIGLQPTDRTQPIKAKLFADDTTVFLSDRDSWNTLTDVLDTWCLASGARFNSDKTIVLPVGPPAYRSHVLNTRCLGAIQMPIPPSIHIASEGEPVRVLGAYIGNGVNQTAVWTPTIDKIDDTLSQWAKSHPTLNGKCLIINMEVGGRTQYLTYVQGMPDQILRRLQKTIGSFIWNGNKRHPIALNTLYDHPIPIWAYLADDLFCINARPKPFPFLGPSVKLNPFIQSWKVHTRGTHCTLPQNLIRLVKTAQKYNVTLSPLALTPALKSAIPAWFHPSNNPHITPKSSRTMKCLSTNHRITYIQDMVDFATTPLPDMHRDNPFCMCAVCTQARLHGCHSLTQCHLDAGLFVFQLPAFWNPLVPTHDLYYNDVPTTPCPGNSETTSFDPRITIQSIGEAYRIFCSPPTPMLINSTPRTSLPTSCPTVTIYTDGSSKVGPNETLAAGSGVWYAPDDARNQAIRLPPSLPQTNNSAELVAILTALRATPNSTRLRIMSDSQYAIDALTETLQKAEDANFTGFSNELVIRTIASKLRERSAITSFTKVRGHSVGLVLLPYDFP
ncbi:hypothetical protein AX17_004355 [Amanita inopinata Kibby_2008]|nr:hypothetical protein AX17_004355 [Amanita inopinata Kibby_2008]